ncbi:condensation domain-containing protein, partial [Paenibacillus sonchi]
YYRLSSQQERLYVLQQFEAIGTAYNVTWAAQVQGPFDPVRCEAAFAAVSQRHESLRTCFEMIGDTVVQHVRPRARGFFEYEDVPGGDHRSLIGPFVRPFELRTGPLFRVKVVRTGREEYLLLLDMHHMITDGVSQDIVLKEFTALYEGAVLEPLRMQYKDYASWQSGQSGTVREQGQYWLELFQGELPVLDLTPDYPRPVVQSFEGDKLHARLDAERTGEVKRLAEATDTTLFIVLLAAYDVLLHKYTGQGDIIVGSPFAGRRHAELEPVVGMFVNTVALRNFPQRDKTVRSFLAEVKESCLKAYEHQEFSFEQLIEQLQLPRDFSRNPLFDTMFVLQNMEGYTPDIKNVQMTAYPVNNGIAKFDLTLEAAEKKDGSLQLSLEYCTKLFRRDTMERFLHHYMNIVEHMSGNLDQRLSEIDMLSGAERKQGTYYPASPAQKSIFMADKLSGRGTAYNVPVIRRIKGMLDAGRLGEALKKLVNRHESLRTTFELDADSGMLRQKVHPAVSFAFPVYELSETETVLLIQDFVRPFRLDKPPLFRTALIRLTDREETVLIIDMHHIITDGMSVSILLRDLAALYENKELEVLKLQYKDYAIRQSQLAGTEQWNRQEEYWLGVFHEPVPALPWAGRRTEHRAGEDPSRTAYFAMDEQTSCALHRLAQTTESTLFMVLMAAFTALLSKLSDCEDIIVGMPTSGRHHEGLDNIVGMLVNTLAVRFFACRKLSFQEYLHQVKEKLIEAYENQDYPLDSLVEKLNGSHYLQGRPLFNVMFQFAEMEAAEQIDAIDMVPFGHDSVPGKFDLHFIVVQENSSLGLEITYFESLFSEETIGELISGFIEIIQVITSNLETGLGDLLKRQSVLPST